jgi:DNA polymerase-3 subunit gamma/tau
VPEAPAPKPSQVKKVNLKPTAKILTPDAIIARNKSVENQEVAGPPNFKDEAVDQPIEFDDLVKHWNKFANKRREEGKNTEYVLLNQPISLEEGHIIKIKLTNTVQLPILDGVKTDLLQFLRENLCNSKITIDQDMIAPDDSNMVYTDKEKFNYLAEKYPHLKELQKRLGLDTEY